MDSDDDEEAVEYNEDSAEYECPAEKCGVMGSGRRAGDMAIATGEDGAEYAGV